VEGGDWVNCVIDRVGYWTIIYVIFLALDL
jgi:hypothetical protein